MSGPGRFYAEIYGCSMNRGEAELFLGRLEAAGLVPTDDPAEADVSFLFTCTVIGSTERRMLRAAAALPGPLFVGGCMPAVQADRVRETRPDALQFPPDRYDAMLRAALDALRGPGGTRAPAGDVRRRPRDIRRYPLGDCAAIVPIASGCVGGCTYCLTRIARPGLVSRPPEEIARLVASHARAGAAEVRLSAQDAAAYGRDIGTDLPRLISLLSAGPGPLLRVGMMNPDTVAPMLGRIVDAFRGERVFKFLHLPLQSGSDRVLDAMGRGYSAADHFAIVGAFREAFPGLTHSTDVIVGYPGETGEDHRATVEAVRRLRPSILNVTRFSPRPGTPAAALEPVAGAVAKERSRELTAVHRRIALEANLSRVGSSARAVVTEPGSGGTVIARDTDYVPIVLRGTHPVGTWMEVEVVRATAAYVVGRPL